MKKLLVCMITGALLLGLSACGSSSDEEQPVAASGEETAAGSTQEAEETEEISESAEAEEAAEAGSEQEQEAAEEKTEQEQEQEAADVPDVSNAVEGSETSEADPVPYGSWAKTALYATQDSTYHTVYVRVTKVTTQSEDSAYVDSAIEANNGFGGEDEQFDPAQMDVPEDGELVVMDYEVYVPSDFPAPNYGMTEPKMYFSMKNIGESGFTSADGSDTYFSLGSTQDLIVREAGETYEPGNTYGERCIFAMIVGYTNYDATYSSYPDGTASDETSTDNMYTVYHSVTPAS